MRPKWINQCMKTIVFQAYIADFDDESDGHTDGLTDPLIEMRGRIKKEKEEKIIHEREVRDAYMRAVIKSNGSPFSSLPRVIE